MLRSLTVALLLSLLPALPLRAETPPEQEAAIKSIRGWASNLQKNRDGTVRFIRFSKAGVTDEHLAHIVAFKQLDYLAVVSPQVTDEGLKSVAGLTNLDTLFLSDSALTDKAMPALRGLEKLEHLYLDRTQVSDAGLEHVANLKTLKTVSLRQTAITDTGLAQLSALENLEVIFLNETSITDAGLQHLAGLKNLRALYLDGTKVVGPGLSQVSSLEKLSVLSLRKTELTGFDVATFKAPAALTQLLLFGSTLAAESVASLKQSHPRLNVDLTPTPDRSKNALQKYLAGESLQSASGGNVDSQNASTQKQTESAKPVLPAAKVRFTSSEKGTPDFQRHVIPLLGRLGCNGRTCHGSFQGKGGFSLSMFGYDFAADHEALTDGDEPRVNIDDVASSLILNKPTSEDDHGGGQRFKTGGWEYQLLHRWISGGAKGVAEKPAKIVRFDVTPAEVVFAKPGETRQLKCVAVWSDGTREDVTCLTRFQTNDDVVAEVTPDGLITCKSPGDTYVITFYDNAVFSSQVLLPVSDQTGDRYPVVDAPTPIDKLVISKLSKLGVVPSDVCSDEEFLRRVSLDMVGTLPSPAEIEAFLADPSPDKRARKVDELLDSEAYVAWWGVKLSDLTGSNSQALGSTDMNSPASAQWNAWIQRRLRDNVGWDRIAAGMILAESRRPGQSYENYAAEQSMHMKRKDGTDFSALENPMHYYWFRSNNQTPTDRALAFGYVFLGVRLQCAQCHKHPFDQWSKQDFEKFTQFFTRIKSGIAPDALTTQHELKRKLGVPKKLDTAALRRQMYLRVSAEGLPIPWNEIWIDKPGRNPQIAKLLADEEFDLNDFEDPREPLMDWLVRKDNPYFARAFVNRIWAHYFGAGIVEPADDFNMANPPSNKGLLDWLGDRFVENGYDLKWLHRTIAASDTYQRSRLKNASNKNDERNFSRARIRRMPAEVMVDAILRATARDDLAAKYLDTVNARKIAQHPKSFQARGIDYSLLVFGKPRRTTNCDCERQSQPTLLQSLYVRNDDEMLGWLERNDGWLVSVAKKLKQPLSSDVKPSPDKPTTVASESPSAEEVTELVRSLYLRTLSRVPTESEIDRSTKHIASVENTVEGLRDLMWALLNTQEFLTNH